MKKIPSLFQRNYDGDRLVRDEVAGGCEWVLAGEGRATRKFDGTACLIRDGRLYRRYDVKKGRQKPDDFIPAQDPDPVTGHWPGWVPCRREDKADKWHWEAFDNHPAPFSTETLANGTYELVGPKIQGGAEKAFVNHALLAHGETPLLDVPTTFNGIRDYLRDKDIEGIVWHHPDGRMAKIKKRDFGLKR